MIKNYHLMHFLTLIFFIPFVKALNIDNHMPFDTVVTITRDNFGVPIIHGGHLSNVAHAIGLVQAQDRLWQIFFITTVANGRAAQYFGISYFDSDVMQAQINYTDEQVQQQIDTYFSTTAVTIYTNYVNGLNDYVAQVNADNSLMPFELSSVGFGPSNPVPQFTIYDIIRANQFILQQFSPTTIPSFQLDNFSDLDQIMSLSNITVSEALQIFSDIDPTTAQVKSQFTVVPNNDCTTHQKESFNENNIEWSDSIHALALDAKNLAKKLRDIKELRHKNGVPRLGSNGEAISAAKSASGNPMIRIAPQPNFNQPSDFYQIRVESPNLTANGFTIPTFPLLLESVFVPVQGKFGFGLALQVGHLPSNDFLIESVNNIDHSSARKVTIQIAGHSARTITVYRSTSSGWVVTHPINNSTTTITTLRSVFIDRQLSVLNTFVDTISATSYNDFLNSFLNSKNQSDIMLLEGDYVDSTGVIAAFHTGGWTQLPSQYDRRFPQGIPTNPAAPNSLYTYDALHKDPLTDHNTSRGFYVGWNSLFKQGAEGSSDTVFPVGINRMYWLDLYLSNTGTISFKYLTDIGLRQYLANNNTVLDSTALDQDADLFTPLFKDRFFQAVINNPTSNRLQALEFLEDFSGNWFDGDLDHILNSSDVSDQRMLASIWLNAVAHAVLNPYLNKTSREVATATKSNPIPTFNAQGVYNDLTSQANTLSRIFGLACDNTIFFDGWLNNQPAIDQIIVNGLDFALKILGGFSAQPWGAGKRGVYQFNNAVLGAVASMNACNVSGIILAAEFAPDQINMESILVLGESGQILTDTSGNPVFNEHCFDQQPLFSQLQLRSNPPFKMGN